MNQKQLRHLLFCIANLILFNHFTISYLFGQEEQLKVLGINNPTISQLENQNIPGGDYKSFELKPGETCQACIDACLNDPNCKAYTYVKPGVQRQNAVCWLKSAVSNPVVESNCISGIKGTIIEQFQHPTDIEAQSQEQIRTAEKVSALHGGSLRGDGVTGQSGGEIKSGVYGYNTNKLGYGVFGRNSETGNTGYLGGPEAGVCGEGGVNGMAAIFNGNVKITGGTPAVGQVLTSDDTGLATWEPPNGGGHYIGESYSGGIVFFVYDNGHHGLVAAYYDESFFDYKLNKPMEGGLWCLLNDIRFIGANADGVGAGAMNTTLIISAQIHNIDKYYNFPYAAYQSRLLNKFGNEGHFVQKQNYVLYGDWYLPSCYELGLLFLQKKVVGNFTGGAIYWSSTEFIKDKAWAISFDSGYMFPYAKDLQARVRRIRTF